MSNNVIKVENLGKKYMISHQQEGRGRYVALRDIIAETAKNISAKILHPFSRPSSLVSRPSSQEEFWALKDVSFEVKQGDRIGIIGRNGAGKSTLLKILSRITEPTIGRVSIKGRVASLLEVGTGFHPELTGRENIYLNGAILGMKRAEINRKFDEIVAFAEVEKFLDTPVKRYSSGMYVRLAFAVAAHLEPEILVVDEVLAVGDAQFQKKCLGKMEDVSAKEGRTVLFVSHNMGAVNNLCNKIILLSSGSLSFKGDVREGILNYTSELKDSSAVIFNDFKGERRGNQDHATLLSMSVLDETGHECNILKMGRPMTVRLKMCVNKALKAPRIGVMLRGQNDILIHDFCSAFDGFQPDLEPGIHMFEIFIEKLMVYPGTYTIGPWIQTKVGIPSEDYIRAALLINIIDSKQVGGPNADFDKISKEGTEIYLPCKWKIIN